MRDLSDILYSRLLSGFYHYVSYLLWYFFAVKAWENFFHACEKQSHVLVIDNLPNIIKTLVRQWRPTYVAQQGTSNKYYNCHVSLTLRHMLLSADALHSLHISSDLLNVAWFNGICNISDIRENDNSCLHCLHKEKYSTSLPFLFLPYTHIVYLCHL